MTSYAKEFLWTNRAATVARGAVVGFLAVQVAACGAMSPVAGNEPSAHSNRVAERARAAERGAPTNQQWPEWLLRESVGAAPAMAMINPPWKEHAKGGHTWSREPARSVTSAAATVATVTQHEGLPAPAVTRTSSSRTASIATRPPKGTASAPKTVEVAMLSNSDPSEVMKSLSKHDGASVDDDSVLAGQRGRGIAGSNVVYFGLQMMTNASGANGFNATAGAQFAMDTGSVVVNQAWTVQSGSPNFSTTGNTVSGQLGNIGVGQLVQVAGNSNGGTNSTIINVTAPDTPGGHLGFSPPQISTGCSAGVNCQAGIGSGGIATSITVPGLMGSNVINMTNGISQQVAISTVGAVVHNILTLNVELGSQQTIAKGFLSNLLRGR